MKQTYVLSLDQGTTSTRCVLFDSAGRVVSFAQREHRQHYPAAGRVEHDALEIWRSVTRLVPRVLRDAAITADQVAAIGIANQRETIVVWDRRSGQPVGRAIVWLDTRTDSLVERLRSQPGADLVRARCGLPLTSYFAAPRLRWILDRTAGLRDRAERGDVLFGTMESWLIWNLTGGPHGGVHVTDVTNASRTMLMNLETLAWDDDLLTFFDIPRAMLPDIRSSAEHFGHTTIEPSGIPITAALGDQQAALFGQTCFAAGEAKCTYGAGGFLLLNTGAAPVHSTHGLLTTVAFRIGEQPAQYALEGSIAVTGSLVQWLRDRIRLIASAPEVETLARTVDDNGGCYIVPAFSGLFSPRWRDDARGVIAGLTAYVTDGHIARAVLESTAWQTREVVDAMNSDFGRPLRRLNVDGGMTSNNLLMQTVADVLNVPVDRPLVAESVSRGAAYAAGLAVGYWADLSVLRRNKHRAAEWVPAMTSERRATEYDNWRRAVTLTYNWTTPGPDPAVNGGRDAADLLLDDHRELESLLRRTRLATTGRPDLLRELGARLDCTQARLRSAAATLDAATELVDRLDAIAERIRQLSARAVAAEPSVDTDLAATGRQISDYIGAAELSVVPALRARAPDRPAPPPGRPN